MNRQTRFRELFHFRVCPGSQRLRRHHVSDYADHRKLFYFGKSKKRVKGTIRQKNMYMRVFTHPIAVIKKFENCPIKRKMWVSA